MWRWRKDGGLTARDLQILSCHDSLAPSWELQTPICHWTAHPRTLQRLSKSTGLPTLPCTEQGGLVDVASRVEMNPLTRLSAFEMIRNPLSTHVRREAGRFAACVPRDLGSFEAFGFAGLRAVVWCEGVGWQGQTSRRWRLNQQSGKVGKRREFDRIRDAAFRSRTTVNGQSSVELW